MLRRRARAYSSSVHELSWSMSIHFIAIQFSVAGITEKLVKPLYWGFNVI